MPRGAIDATIPVTGNVGPQSLPAAAVRLAAKLGLTPDPPPKPIGFDKRQQEFDKAFAEAFGMKKRDTPARARTAGKGR